MHANSRPVTSNQQRPHEALARVLGRSRGPCRFARPVDPGTAARFTALDAARRAHGGPLVLDAGCGTATSTRVLAARHPDAFVVGVDRSAQRLARAGVGAAGLLLAGNLALLRADLADAWQLAHAAAWRLWYHYLLYPNPWPKRRHLRRRWHAQPVFRTALALGGVLELRSNWAVYAAEHARALALIDGRRAHPQHLPDREPTLSPFEAKYRASGHALWQVIAPPPAVLPPRRAAGTGEHR